MLASRVRVVSMCALLIGAAIGRGSAAQEAASDAFQLSLSPTQPIYADSAPPAPSADQRPLMGLLSQTPLGPGLEQSRINIFGWIEGSYEYNFNNVHFPHLNNLRSFDLFELNKGLLNQVDLSIERKVDVAGHQFDVGGRVDALYGSDGRIIASNGLFDHQASLDQELWFDLPQAYADIAIPVGEGLRLRAGKFEFFKFSDPNASTFYTRSFQYSQTFPYTLTGISAYYAFGKTASVEGGVSRGWDQSLKDNNGAIDGFGRVTWNASERARFSLAGITGPEQFADNNHYTTAIDLTFAYAATDQLILLFDGVYGHQDSARFQEFPGNPKPAIDPTTDTRFPPDGSANWYGLSAVAKYRVNEFLSVNGRGEWYRAEEGFTTINSRQGENLFEATVGVTVTPFAGTALGQNFQLRPEARYDYSSNAIFENARSGLRYDQFTLAIDAIFNF